MRVVAHDLLLLLHHATATGIAARDVVTVFVLAACTT
jgi:hypothetical protein